MTSFSSTINSISSDPVMRKTWSSVCAFAWLQTSKGSQVLDNLRKDPKKTIQEIAKGEYGASTEVAKQAAIIVQKTNDPEAAYSGYLPIPAPVGGLEKSTKDELRILLQAGITGTLRFDERADLWADIFLKAWNDPQLLHKIRQAPLENLPYVEELKNSKYGILPIPDQPEDLPPLEIEQLEGCANLDNLGGIFALGCSCC